MTLKELIPNSFILIDDIDGTRKLVQVTEAGTTYRDFVESHLPNEPIPILDTYNPEQLPSIGDWFESLEEPRRTQLVALHAELLEMPNMDFLTAIRGTYAAYQNGVYTIEFGVRAGREQSDIILSTNARVAALAKRAMAAKSA